MVRPESTPSTRSTCKRKPARTRLPRAERRREVHHRPGATRAVGADAGQVRLLHGDPWRDTARLHRRIAYVSGEVNLWPNLSGGEVIDLLRPARGDLDKKRRDQLLERFELDPRKRAAATPRATAKRSRSWRPWRPTPSC